MRKNKTQKGITLIALIITIVVLLILAVVAIRAVQGDGIIARAKETTSKYTEAQAKEKLELGMQSYRLAHNGNFDANDFVLNVRNYIEDAEIVSEAVVKVDGYNINVVEKTANWSIEPTAGTWYVSDECLLFDEEGYVYGYKTDFDWCKKVGEEGWPTYAIYDTAINNAGTTKLVFSSKVNKIKTGEDLEDNFWRLINIELSSYHSNPAEIEFLASNVQFHQEFEGSGSDIEQYEVPKNFKNLPNGFMRGATMLTELIIPSSVESIGETTFAGLGCASQQVTVKVVQGSTADTWITNIKNQGDTDYHWASYITVQYITE